jgi:hypothetical protein
MQKYNTLIGVEEKIMQKILEKLKYRAVAFSELIDGII